MRVAQHGPQPSAFVRAYSPWLPNGIDATYPRLPRAVRRARRPNRSMGPSVRQGGATPCHLASHPIGTGSSSTRRSSSPWHSCHSLRARRSARTAANWTKLERRVRHYRPSFTRRDPTLAPDILRDVWPRPTRPWHRRGFASSGAGVAIAEICSIAVVAVLGWLLGITVLPRLHASWASWPTTDSVACRGWWQGLASHFGSGRCRDG